MMQSGERTDDVTVVAIEEQGTMNVKERDSAGPLKSLISGVRDWVTVVGAYEPYLGLADRSGSRTIESRRFQEQSRLHWPDGVPVNRLYDSSDRARWN